MSWLKFGEKAAAGRAQRLASSPESVQERIDRVLPANGPDNVIVPREGWNSENVTPEILIRLNRRMIAAQRVARAQGIRRVSTILKDHFTEQIETIIDRTVKRAERIHGVTKAYGKKESVTLSFESHERLWADVIQEVIPGTEVIGGFAEEAESVAYSTYGRIGLLFGSTQPDPIQLNKLRVSAREVARKVTQVGETTKNRLGNLIQKSVREGATVFEVAAEIRKRFPGIAANRIPTIARTEMSYMTNLGAARAMQDSGVVKFSSVVGCEAIEEGSPTYMGVHTCNITNVPIKDVHLVDFHPNHSGYWIAAGFVEPDGSFQDMPLAEGIGDGTPVGGEAPVDGGFPGITEQPKGSLMGQMLGLNTNKALFLENPWGGKSWNEPAFLDAFGDLPSYAYGTARGFAQVASTFGAEFAGQNLALKISKQAGRATYAQLRSLNNPDRMIELYHSAERAKWDYAADSFAGVVGHEAGHAFDDIHGARKWKMLNGDAPEWLTWKEAGVSVNDAEFVNAWKADVVALSPKAQSDLRYFISGEMDRSLTLEAFENVSPGLNNFMLDPLSKSAVRSGLNETFAEAIGLHTNYGVSSAAKESLFAEYFPKSMARAKELLESRNGIRAAEHVVTSMRRHPSLGFQDFVQSAKNAGFTQTEIASGLSWLRGEMAAGRMATNQMKVVGKFTAQMDELVGSTPKIPKIPAGVPFAPAPPPVPKVTIGQAKPVTPKAEIFKDGQTLTEVVEDATNQAFGEPISHKLAIDEIAKVKDPNSKYELARDYAEALLSGGAPGRNPTGAAELNLLKMLEEIPNVRVIPGQAAGEVVEFNGALQFLLGEAKLPKGAKVRIVQPAIEVYNPTTQGRFMIHRARVELAEAVVPKVSTVEIQGVKIRPVSEQELGITLLNESGGSAFWDEADAFLAGHPEFVKAGISRNELAASLDYQADTFETVNNALEKGDWNSPGGILGRGVNNTIVKAEQAGLGDAALTVFRGEQGIASAVLRYPEGKIITSRRILSTSKGKTRGEWAAYPVQITIRKPKGIGLEFRKVSTNLTEQHEVILAPGTRFRVVKNVEEAGKRRIELEVVSEAPLKKPKGRPRKHPLPDPNAPKKPRGRPKKPAPAELTQPVTPENSPWLKRMAESENGYLKATASNVHGMAGEKARFYAARALAEGLEKEINLLSGKPTKAQMAKLAEIEDALKSIPGVKRQGTLNREIVFKGALHVSDSPLFNGDKARIIRHGWSVDGRIARKTKVVPLTDRSKPLKIRKPKTAPKAPAKKPLVSVAPGDTREASMLEQVASAMEGLPKGTRLEPKQLELLFMQVETSSAIYRPYTLRELRDFLKSRGEKLALPQATVQQWKETYRFLPKSDIPPEILKMRDVVARLKRLDKKLSAEAPPKAPKTPAKKPAAAKPLPGPEKVTGAISKNLGYKTPEAMRSGLRANRAEAVAGNEAAMDANIREAGYLADAWEKLPASPAKDKVAELLKEAGAMSTESVDDIVIFRRTNHVSPTKMEAGDYARVVRPGWEIQRPPKGGGVHPPGTPRAQQGWKRIAKAEVAPITDAEMLDAARARAAPSKIPDITKKDLAKALKKEYAEEAKEMLDPGINPKAGKLVDAGVTLPEIQAVHYYQLDDCADMNRLTREGAFDSQNGAVARGLNGLIHKMEDGGLGDTAQAVFRGEKDLARAVAAYPEGKTVEVTQFLSTSTGGISGQWQKSPVHIEIRKNAGVGVNLNASGLTDQLTAEKEVLFAPGLRLKIVKHEMSGGRLHIVAEALGY